MIVKLAIQSLWNRKVTALLTIIAIAVSVFVLLGVEHVRREAKSCFTRTLSDTDLIIGARTGQMNLLLYSVFRIGSATNNISWQSYQRLSKVSAVKWSIPLSLGDSHKGYRVLGTTDEYIKHYRYGHKKPLAVAQGKWFEDTFDVVIGAEVAQQLGYGLDTSLVLAHGVSSTSFSLHDDKPFRVVGILAPTGTPVDQTLHVSLAAIEAIHIGWKNGVRLPTGQISQQPLSTDDFTPKSITAFLLGLKSKTTTFGFQRLVNDYPSEALMAILPGATLASLWRMLNSVESALLVISVLVLLSSLIGMATMLLSSLRERGRELAMLRAIGAGPLFNVVLIELEVLWLTLSGIALAVISLILVLWLGGDFLMVEYGLFVSHQVITADTINVLIAVVIGALCIGVIPSWAAYRKSLHQGLMVSQ